MRTYQVGLWIEVRVHQLLSHTGEADNLGRSLTHEDGCLSKPHLTLEAWRIPGELLVFNLCWNSKNLFLILAEEHVSNRIDEPASERGDNQAKPKCPSMVFYVGYH